MADEDGPKTILRLDGSHGLGCNARVTVVTADRVNGQKEEVYEIPYAFLNDSNLKLLKTAIDSGFILAYRIEKIVTPDMKTLCYTTEGLQVDPGEEGR
jgi:hypothetical protein